MMARKEKLPKGIKRIIYFIKRAQPEQPPPAKSAAPQRSEPAAAPHHESAGTKPGHPIAPQPTQVDAKMAKPGRLPQSYRVVITHIHYDGKVHRTQADEFIEIQNQGKVPVDISGWRVSAGNVGQNFQFPAGTLIEPQQSFRVYTDELHPESGGFSFASKRALWNDKGDIGVLFDQSGAEVSRWAYGQKASPAAT